jgi:DNA-binding transcriptional regulator YdaS (Cro superfamily)
MSNFDLRAALRSSGLKQRAVADALGVSEPTVSIWASSRIPAERVRPLAALLRVDPSDIRPDLFAGLVETAEAAP